MPNRIAVIPLAMLQRKREGPRFARALINVRSSVTLVTFKRFENVRNNPNLEIEDFDKQ